MLIENVDASGLGVYAQDEPLVELPHDLESQEVILMELEVLVFKICCLEANRV